MKTVEPVVGHILMIGSFIYRKKWVG